MDNVNHYKYAAGASALGAAAGAGYVASLWPKMTSWGARHDEVDEALPGDDLVGQARYRATHAVTITSTPEQVWPWLVQMGQGRGGLYSYDWLENAVGLHMHSADRIVPSLQSLAVGDVIRMVPEGNEPSLRFAVAQIDAPHLLVLGPDTTRDEAFAKNMPYPCWTFRLSADGPSCTRLVVRFQSDFEPSPMGLLMNKYALQPVHFVMERKMMLGIKRRAENAA